MNQTLVPDKIVLNLPYVFKRDNSMYNSIPDFIKNNPDETKIFIIKNFCSKKHINYIII